MQRLTINIQSQEQFDYLVSQLGVDVVISAGIEATIYDDGHLSSFYQKYRDEVFQALCKTNQPAWKLLDTVMESGIVFTDSQLLHFWDEDEERENPYKLVLLADYFTQNDITPYGQWVDLFEEHRKKIENWECIDWDVLQFIYGNFRCYFTSVGGMKHGTPRILFPDLHARTETINAISALVGSIAYLVEGKSKLAIYDFMAGETFYDTQKVGIKMLKDCQENMVRLLFSVVGIKFGIFSVENIDYPPRNAEGLFKHPFINFKFAEKRIDGTIAKLRHTFTTDAIPHTLEDLKLMIKHELLLVGLWS